MQGSTDGGLFWPILKLFNNQYRLPPPKLEADLELGRFRARPIKSAKCKIFKFNLKSTFSPFFGAMSLPHTSKDLKDQIILATGRGILADFWVPHEIDN